MEASICHEKEEVTSSGKHFVNVLFCRFQLQQHQDISR